MTWCGAAAASSAGRILIRRIGVYYILGRNAEALRDAQAAVGLLSGAGDLVWEARALHWRAAVYLAMGDIERADRDYARVEALWVECGQQLEYAVARQERGLAAHARGDLPTALAHLDHAQALYDELGVFQAEFFVNKCTVLLAAGLTRDALLEANAAVARIERDHGSTTRRAELLYSSALAAAATGDFEPGAGSQRRSPAVVPPPAAPVVGGASRVGPAALPVRRGRGPSAHCCRRPGG